MIKKHILLSNDDGYQAPGIMALARRLTSFAHVTIVAPDRERSAVGHGLTFFHPLRVKKHDEEENLIIYSTDGTPTDCVLLGVYELMPVKPDLVMSGINRGGNLGDDLTYSGTVAAAMEGAIQGYPAAAVSLSAFNSNADYNPAAIIGAQSAKKILHEGLPDGVFLNINVPALPFQDIAGVEITCQGRSNYKQSIQKRIDPKGIDYYWIDGTPPTGEAIEGTDFWAVSKGRVSITPLHLSFTQFDMIPQIKKWNMESILSDFIIERERKEADFSCNCSNIDFCK